MSTDDAWITRAAFVSGVIVGSFAGFILALMMR